MFNDLSALEAADVDHIDCHSLACGPSAHECAENLKTGSILVARTSITTHKMRNDQPSGSSFRLDSKFRAASLC